ncbi:HD domain-containing protein [Planctomicrobium piriforme]|uniref:HD superfamily phosphohydrolase n=1 Tax=Planctomicrobium piriforme TaxID=1576369 RepID=A0A1I3D0B9_9PLAN|nr:HD domain-containing protein [Planctomicrobium piriforme]SFH80066.1 HD superfamily phosphohydrolase [Planctomicrobium piriforme]
MSELHLIPELADLQSGRSLIRVPAEQNVPFTRRVRALVDTEEFQRLGEISQLGLVSKVYPGAKHTRFEHALGVYHNALRYLQQLVKDRRFRAQIDDHSIELLIVSSLLHDVGHWPFCHPIEDMGLKGLPPHEAHAARFLGEGTELADVLRRDWRIEPSEVLDILAPRTQSPRLKLLRSILSGPIDVDKMDYLDRDSLHCGVPYGRNFDRQRLIQSLVLNAAGDGLAITVKGKTAAELMVFARYVMFSEVYWHHAVRSATSMFARGFYELHDRFNLTELFGCTDAEMIAAFREAAKGHRCEQLLGGIFGRKRSLYKQAVEYSHDRSPEIYQRIAGRPYGDVLQIARRLVEKLNAEQGLKLDPLDILIDAPPPHREVEFAIDVYFPKEGCYRPLRTVSPVVEALATTQFDDWVKRVRVFVAPHVALSLRSADWDELLQAVTEVPA